MTAALLWGVVIYVAIVVGITLLFPPDFTGPAR